MDKQCKDKIKERIDILEAVVTQLERRIHSARNPDIVGQRATELEKIAEETFDLAQRLRSQLAEDVEQIEKLREERIGVKLRIEVMRMLLRNDIQPGNNVSIDRFVERVLLTLLKR